ncbi:hypothetical protein [Sphingobium sp. Ant17]|uniref:hypothetical protein n=1 Tax=Sphingobium sp. Ant17 TaxID=1461752 RepID=UPI0004525B6F|nr:hypothetical protein [Sphingobium sp. Ant17]EXS71204.1 hypothetical protein BF95_02335 [Sphingobium sp. Ant17]
MVSGKAKETDRDRAYGTLRLRALSGQLNEGDVVAATDVQAEFGCTSTAAMHVLWALAADGYLESNLRPYRGSLWTSERFDEYLSQMAVFMEIAGNRIVGDNPARLQKLRILRTSLDDLDPVSEAHYLTCVEWIHVVLEARGRRSFTELVSSIVPQCLLRLSWIAVEGTRRANMQCSNSRQPWWRKTASRPGQYPMDFGLACVLWFLMFWRAGRQAA